ncbi:ankyrin repeat protein, putative [Trichomonas vaginalis G3]|uniref:Ankyrin repeat protein, putative n=1 Tax=Trichomonas vaginalis (strain ATCC PRA-98 / G3) TaxID=412133 RepID=A2FU73_TRIV3|nr:proteasome regulatory particle assembly [Trichomonas vaginalis G3]EAX91534.1 ankyrin repeat protein, putative [Trichomonas vaginalis G3]KAI5509559.1 proteasome regulatory particle assembly [Trichomonas vaginalis G3]|eukprot:XP_001304464.1 ankyrin repeat protein [Trichomonas vaginalis G3]
MIELLIKHGADVNIKNNKGMTALFETVLFYHSLKTAELLLNHGANVNMQDYDGSTPLHTLIKWSDNLVAAKMLVSHGALINIQNNKGENAISYASSLNRGKILDFLTSCGQN